MGLLSTCTLRPSNYCSPLPSLTHSAPFFAWRGKIYTSYPIYLYPGMQKRQLSFSSAFLQQHLQQAQANTLLSSENECSSDTQRGERTYLANIKYRLGGHWEVSAAIRRIDCLRKWGSHCSHHLEGPIHLMMSWAMCFSLWGMAAILQNILTAYLNGNCKQLTTACSATEYGQKKDIVCYKAEEW